MPPIILTRSLLVIILPGMVAVAPWLFIIISQVPGDSNFYDKYQLLVNACLFAFVVVLGCIFEGVNSHLEVKWDKEREEKYGVTRNWHDYLALAYNAEMVGLKYIARIATSMYFELAMVWAFLFFGVGAIGILWLFANSMLFVGGSITALLITVAAPCYFLKQARLSHEVLCICRQELNARLCRDVSRQTSLPSGGTFQLSEG